MTSTGRGGRAGGASTSWDVLIEGVGEGTRRGLVESTWCSGEGGVDGLVVWAAVSAGFLSACLTATRGNHSCQSEINRFK